MRFFLVVLLVFFRVATFASQENFRIFEQGDGVDLREITLNQETVDANLQMERELSAAITELEGAGENKATVSKIGREKLSRIIKEKPGYFMPLEFKERLGSIRHDLIFSKEQTGAIKALKKAKELLENRQSFYRGAQVFMDGVAYTIGELDSSSQDLTPNLRTREVLANIASALDRDFVQNNLAESSFPSDAVPATLRTHIEALKSVEKNLPEGFLKRLKELEQQLNRLPAQNPSAQYLSQLKKITSDFVRFLNNKGAYYVGKTLKLNGMSFRVERADPLEGYYPKVRPGYMDNQFVGAVKTSRGYRYVRYFYKGIALAIPLAVGSALAGKTAEVRAADSAGSEKLSIQSGLPPRLRNGPGGVQ